MCDTVVAVSERGVFFAKNSDRDANEAQVLEWHPRRAHPAGARLRCTWVSIPEVRETHAVLLSRPFWMWGAEIGTNEHGVTIGNEAVFTRDAVPSVGLTGMDLLRLALERATTAREAVQTIVELAEQHGQGGRCGHEDPSFRYFSSFLVADRRGAFVLETAGKEHAIEPVEGVRSISNALTIPSFASAHADRLMDLAVHAKARRACTATSVARARDVGDLMRAMRDHGGPTPSYGPIVGAMGAPCVHPGGLFGASQTVASWVAELSAERVAHWVTGTAAPCTSIYKPVSVDTPVDLGSVPGDRDDGRSLFWRHERFHRAVMRDPEALFPRFAPERDRLERAWIARPPPSAAAFAEADTLLEQWTSRVGSTKDRRPPWAQRFWRRREAWAR